MKGSLTPVLSYFMQSGSHAQISLRRLPCRSTPPARLRSPGPLSVAIQEPDGRAGGS